MSTSHTLGQSNFEGEIAVLEGTFFFWQVDITPKVAE